MSALRDTIAGLIEEAVEIKMAIGNAGDESDEQNAPEMIANVTLAYRALEDAAMRFGKAIQASSGGKSPLGGPNTPGTK